MRVLAVRLSSAFLASLIACTVGAQPGLRPLPPLMRTVSDEAGVLSIAQGRKLALELESILDQDGIRVVLVIAETVQPGTIEDYAERLSQRWARDRAIDPSRAIFIILSIDERELVVMPGRSLGLESAFAAAKIEHGLAPLFLQRRYYDALHLLAERVQAVIRTHGAAGQVPQR